jgi:hypothetical protein
MKSSDGNTGSVRVSTIEEGLETFDYEAGIVLYETGPPCTASQIACRFLKLKARSVGAATAVGWRSGKVPGTRWSRARRKTDRRYLHLPLTDNRSGGERGGELEALLHQKLRSFAGCLAWVG